MTTWRVTPESRHRFSKKGVVIGLMLSSCRCLGERTVRCPSGLFSPPALARILQARLNVCVGVWAWICGEGKREWAVCCFFMCQKKIIRVEREKEQGRNPEGPSRATTPCRGTNCLHTMDSHAFFSSRLLPLLDAPSFSSHPLTPFLPARLLFPFPLFLYSFGPFRSFIQ